MASTEPQFDTFIPRSEFTAPPHDVDDLEAFLEKEMMLIDLGIASPGLCAILSAQAPNSVPESTTAFAMVEDMMGAGDRPPAAPGPQSSTASEMVPDTMAAANRIPATLQADKVSESAKKTRKPRKPFKRQNRNNAIIPGNNKFGRRGKLRCGLCRLQHSPCIFKSIDEPCERCQKGKGVGPAETCVKTWGPVTHGKTDSATARISLFEISNDYLVQPDADATNGEVVSSEEGANLNHLASDPIDDDEIDSVLFSFSPGNSRPISLYDETIEPADRAILERQYYSYSRSDPNLVFMLDALVQFIATQYGKSINSPILRQATILCLTSSSSTEGDLMFMRRARLIPALQFRISQTNLLDDSDLLATFIFMFHFVVVDDRDGCLVCLRGCLAIIQHLSDQSTSNEIRLQFKSLWPMIHFYLDVYSLSLGDIPSLLESRRASTSSMRGEQSLRRSCRVLDLAGESRIPNYTVACSAIQNCFLDLCDEVASKKKGLVQSHFQNARTELENAFATWESRIRTHCLRCLVWPGVSQWRRSIIALDIMKFALSCLFLGALYSGQEKANKLALQHESGTFFTLFLREVGILETFTYRIELGSITSNSFKLGPDIDAVIEEVITRQSFYNEIHLVSRFIEDIRKAARQLCDLAPDSMRFALEELIEQFPSIREKEGRGWLLGYLFESVGLE